MRPGHFRPHFFTATAIEAPVSQRPLEASGNKAERFASPTATERMACMNSYLARERCFAE